MTSDEREAYLAHLTRCDLCKGLVGEFQSVVELFPEALDEQAAPSNLKERILSQARVDLESRDVRAPEMVTQARESTRGWGLLAFARPVPVLIAAVLVLIVTGLAAWNVVLQVRVDDQVDISREEQRLLKALSEGAPVSSLSGTESAPDASATLVEALGVNEVFLLVRNLPSLPDDQEYQVWNIMGGVPTSVGTFNVVSEGDEIVTLTADLSGADAVGISVEPKGGSLSPTGDIVLLSSE